MKKIELEEESHLGHKTNTPQKKFNFTKAKSSLGSNFKWTQVNSELAFNKAMPNNRYFKIHY